jgi:hypothetical protein
MLRRDVVAQLDYDAPRRRIDHERILRVDARRQFRRLSESRRGAKERGENGKHVDHENS